jgi:RNA recognition motif-containing protein
MNPDIQYTGNQTYNNLRQDNQGKTVLFVSDLNENVNEQDLENFFQEYKESVAIIQLNKVIKQMDQRQIVNATVIFKNPEKADLARKGLNMKKIKGKSVRIAWHERDNSLRYGTEGNVFVKSIPSNISPREFYEFFLKFGDIISAKLNEDEDGNHHDYGYIHFATKEAASQAISYCEKNKVWEQMIDVKPFQKKNERLNPVNANKSLYIKNLPLNVEDAEIKERFSKYGAVTWMKVVKEKLGNFAIMSYQTEEEASKAINGEKNNVFNGSQLFVEPLMKKNDRLKILTSKIHDSNSKLNQQFKNCNLHVRNLPQECNEEHLTECFGKYGEIRSIKIQRFNLVTKQGDKFIEIPTSREFGFVCFSNEESAIAAKDGLNGKPLPNFPNAKRPILIESFMPKNERNVVMTRYQQQFNPNVQKKMPFMNPMQPFGMNINMRNHPYLAKNVNMPVMQGFQGQYHQRFTQNNIPYQNNKQVIVQNVQPQQVQVTTNVNRNDDFDFKYFESLEDDNSRKEYLGEYIFKRIENHEYCIKNQLNLDTIGKITGMILGIEDFNEIIDISKDNNQLSSRILEALDLLGQTGQ